MESRLSKGGQGSELSMQAGALDYGGVKAKVDTGSLERTKTLSQNILRMSESRKKHRL